MGNPILRFIINRIAVRQGIIVNPQHFINKKLYQSVGYHFVQLHISKLGQAAFTPDFPCILQWIVFINPAGQADCVEDLPRKFSIEVCSQPYVAANALKLGSLPGDQRIHAALNDPLIGLRNLR